MEVKPVSSWSTSMKYSRLPNTSMPMATRENSRPRSFQLVRTVWAMDWSPTDLRASLKILMILAILNTCVMLYCTVLLSTSALYCSVMSVPA